MIDGILTSDLCRLVSVRLTTFIVKLGLFNGRGMGVLRWPHYSELRAHGCSAYVYTCVCSKTKESGHSAQSSAHLEQNRCLAAVYSLGIKE